MTNRIVGAIMAVAVVVIMTMAVIESRERPLKVIGDAPIEQSDSVVLSEIELLPAQVTDDIAPSDSPDEHPTVSGD